jgi:hypothetical protein
VPPASAIALLGPVGGVLCMVQLTMAILSTGSAECIAVSSLIAYDIYRTYFKPEATGKQILMVSRVFVVFWAVIMAVASIVLNEIGVGLGWVYNFMAIALGSAVVPIACAIYTDKLNALFAIAAAVLGNVAALIVWISMAGSLGGTVSVDSLGMLYAQLYGGLTALLASLVVCLIGCVVAPMNFDWNIMLTGIKLVGGDGGEDSDVLGQDIDATPEALLAAKAWIFKYGWGYTLFLCVLWPAACIPFGAFGKSTFQLWAAVALMWGWLAGLTIVILPIYENLDAVMSVMKCKAIESGSSTKADTTSATA